MELVEVEVTVVEDEEEDREKSDVWEYMREFTKATSNEVTQDTISDLAKDALGPGLSNSDSSDGARVK